MEKERKRSWAVAGEKDMQPVGPTASAAQQEEAVVGGDEFQERIAPHELKGEHRQEYLNQLWMEFATVARGGFITLFDAKKIAEDLRVDGEETFLDLAVDNVEKQCLGFHRLIQLLDNMSCSSTEEYRDIEIDQQEMRDNIMTLGPLEYIAHACSKDKDKTVQYKLEVFKNFELTPKRVLLSSTAALMLVILIAILTGMAVMWRTSGEKREKTALKNFHDAVNSLTVILEQDLLLQHTAAMVDQAIVISRWTEVLWLEEFAVKSISVESSTAEAAEVSSIFEQYNLLHAPFDMKLEVMNDLAQLGVVINNPADVLANTAGVSIIDCSVDSPKFVPSNGSAICAQYASSDADRQLTRNIVQLFEAVNALEVSSMLFDQYYLFHGGEILTANGAGCYDENSEFLCQQLIDAVMNSNETKITIPGPGGETYYFGVSRIHYAGLTFALASGTELELLLDTVRQRTVDIVNYLNFKFIRSTEIVVALQNRTSGTVIRQATQFRFVNLCHLECKRFDLSSVNILRAFEKKNFGMQITPDYRPEPVVGAYSYIGQGLNMAVILERDVVEIRGLTFGIITGIIDEVNSRNRGTLEIELVGFEDTPQMKNFYAYDPCPVGTDCVIDERGIENVNGSLGLIFRYDCKHCQRLGELHHEKLVMYTKKKKVVPNSKIPPAYRGFFLREESGETTMQDYAGSDTVTVYGWVENYSVVLTAKIDTSEVLDPINEQIAISVGSGLGFLVVGMLLLMVLSHQSFQAIEEEWSQYKKQIEREQNKFASLVKGIIPPVVAERLMKGQKLIFDHVATAAFVFVDVCGFTELTSGWTPKLVARYITYCIAVMDEVAAICDITKLRSIGNLYTGVGLREEKHKAEAQLHPVCRGVRFAAILMMLFSKIYSHYPFNTKAFRELFKDKQRDNIALDVPTLRIGVHCGPSISGAFTIGKTSHYDFFGVGPSLANRMQQTAAPGRIHITMMVKEMLKPRDPTRKYSFESARKTVVRGQGTITSYFVRSIMEHVPLDLLERMGIQLTSDRVRLDLNDDARKKHGRSESDTRSSRSSRSSHENKSQSSE